MSKYRATSMGLALAALVLAVHYQPLVKGPDARISAAEALLRWESPELEAAVSARPAGNREAVRDFLANQQVQSVANRMGVNTRELSAGVATLDQAALDRITQQSGVGDLAGGDQKIVISTTVIIIALLIIILLVK